MTHPFLIEPVRAQAFAYLCANPNGSRAKWAKALGWTPSKVQRFIDALVRFKLAETETTAYYTVFRPLVEPVSSRSGTDPKPVSNRSAARQAHLEASRSGFSVSRYKGAPANGGNAEAMTCIAIVNEVLGSNFKGSYDPISPDNFGSHNAVAGWLAAGMPLEAMTRLLRMKAAVFNPEKSGGRLPHSLGYFTKWMLREWAIEQRQIPLPLMTVEHSPRRERMAKPAAIGDLAAGIMNDLQRRKNEA